MNLFFETSAELGLNIQKAFQETAELIFLNFTNQQFIKEYKPPPDPVILNKSLVLLIIATICYIWIILTPTTLKIKSIFMSIIYALIEYYFKNSIVYLQNGDISLRIFYRRNKTYKTVKKKIFL